MIGNSASAVKCSWMEERTIFVVGMARRGTSSCPRGGRVSTSLRSTSAYGAVAMYVEDVLTKGVPTLVTSVVLQKKEDEDDIRAWIFGRRSRVCRGD